MAQFVIFGAVVGGECFTANAATKTWQGTGSDFNTGTNWNGGLPGTADIASFAGATPLTVNISSPISITELQFTAAGIGYDLTSGSSNTVPLTLLSTGAGSSGAIDAVNANGTNTIDTALFLGAAAGATQSFTQTAGGTLVLNGVIAGNSGNGVALTTGVYTLTGTNTYTGNTTISGSTSQANVTTIGNSGSNGNIGAGTAINLAGGTLRYTGAGETTNRLVNLSGATTAGGVLDGSSTTAGLVVSGNVTGTGTAGAKVLSLKGDTTTFQNEISGNISDGTGTIGISLNSGQWALSGSNTYSGGGTVNAGVLDINSATALGTGAWVFKSGTTIDNTSAGDLTLTTNNAQTWTSPALNFTGTHSLNLGTGAVLISGSALVVTVNASTLTVGGAVGDAGAAKGFTKSGSGTLVLNGNNTYTGATTINQGALIVNGTPATAQGTFSVSGGTLGGNGTVNTGASVIKIGSTTGGGTLTGGAVGATGMLTLTTSSTGTTGGVFFGGTASAPSIYAVDLGTNSTDTLTVNGLLNVSGTNDEILFNQLSGTTLAAGTYPLATYTNINGIFNNVVGLTSNESLSYSIAGTELDLVVTAAAVPEPSTWEALGAMGVLGLYRLRRFCS